MTGTIRRTFAQVCLETRLGLDLTQQQVADRVGVSRSYIAKLERGRIDPDLSTVERVAEALGLDVQLIARPPIFPGGRHVRDSVHARCSAYVDRRVRTMGFETAREVEIIHGRSHG